MLLSVLLILISVGKVTMRGIVTGEATFYQTFFISEKAYHNLIDSGKSSFVLFNVAVLVGCLLLFSPNFLLFNKQKRKSTINMAINTIGMILIFLSYQFYQYIFMMTIICILFVSNILIQFINNLKNRFDLLLIILSIFIFVVNCYYLFFHFMKQHLWWHWDATDKLLNEMVHISRINMICFALWLIPYGILLVKEIITTHKKPRTVI